MIFKLDLKIPKIIEYVMCPVPKNLNSLIMQNNQAIPFNKENFKQILSKEFAWVIVISIPAALLADYFNIPLAWFLGPMIITSIVTLGGIRTKMPRLVLSTVLIFLGLYIGNYIDQELFAQMHQWVWTSLIMLAYIIISVLLVSKYLQKFSGYEKKLLFFQLLLVHLVLY